MGDAFIVRRGGIADAFAVIAADYPAGSVCTCSKGTRTLRAKDTSGYFLFLIPEAGTWTVSCTNGTKTRSQNVIIQWQYQAAGVSLSYGLYLYENGAVGGYTFAAGGDEGTHTISDKGTYLEVTVGNYVSFGFWCAQKINPTEYSSLNIEFFDATASLAVNRSRFGLSNVTGYDEGDFSAYAAFNSFSGSKTLTVDISNENTSQYVRARGLTAQQGGVFNVKILKIWLE